MSYRTDTVFFDMLRRLVILALILCGAVGPAWVVLRAIPTF